MSDRRRPAEGSTTYDENGKNGILLEVKGLKKYFPVRRGVFMRRVGDVKAVDDVSFFVREGETLGLVGESGCGKTTVGRTILRLYEPTAGQILFRSKILSGEKRAVVPISVANLNAKSLKLYRREAQFIFQDPYSSLNPRMTVESILKEPFVIHRVSGSKTDIDNHITELLNDVGLRSEYRNRYPHQFSGGQRQRIGIARALALRPKLVIADEPVSALDVSIQGQVLNLLRELQEKFSLTYVFIAHDLSVVEYISDRIVVMYLGKIAEVASADRMYREPKHPYTEALLSAVPVPDPDFRRQRILLQGSVPSPVNPPSGCRFHTRCSYAQSKERFLLCSTKEPELADLGNDQFSACHFAATLDLAGIEKPD